MTVQEYANLVTYNKFIFDHAFFNKYVLLVEWKTAVYELQGSEADELEHPEFYEFNRKMYNEWMKIGPEPSWRPYIQMVQDKKMLIIHYLVYYGKVYLPTRPLDLRNLPELNSRTVDTALRKGWISPIADKMQRKAVEILWETKQVHEQNLLLPEWMKQYDFRNHIGSKIWKNKIKGI